MVVVDREAALAFDGDVGADAALSPLGDEELGIVGIGEAPPRAGAALGERGGWGAVRAERRGAPGVDDPSAACAYLEGGLETWGIILGVGFVAHGGRITHLGVAGQGEKGLLQERRSYSL